MRTRELKVARIGNSRGVRLPASSLKRYSVGSVMIMEERADGILLRSAGPTVEKLTWEDTAREMAAANEDWSEWDVLDGDGLDSVPWEASKGGKVGEKRSPTDRDPARARKPSNDTKCAGRTWIPLVGRKWPRRGRWSSSAWTN